MMKSFRFLTPGKLVDADLELVLVRTTPADPVKKYVPGYEFELRETGKPAKIGCIRLRIGRTRPLIGWCGHIGYGVDESARGRRYAARSCRLLFPLAYAHGLRTLWITCDPKNMASRRTCELAGGHYVDTVRVPKGTEMYADGSRRVRRYRYDLAGILRTMGSTVKEGVMNRYDAKWVQTYYDQYGELAEDTARRTEGGGQVRNRTNAAHYGWGDGCDGWRLHEDDDFGVIEELVPPGRAEVPHRHTRAGQVFVILEGEADLILEGGRHTLRSGDSLHVPAGVLHQFRNDSPNPVRFLVISAPRRGWDRIEDEQPGMPAPAAREGSLKRMPTLETARLVLRPFFTADAAEVMRLAGDRAVADTTLHIPHPYQPGMAEEWIAAHQPAFDKEQGVTLAITRKPDGALVGAISLGMARGHQAELGYWIGKPFWGRGYCTEAAQALLRYAFTELGLVRVHSCHFARNPASGRVMQKIGMVKEGCRRQHVKKWDKLEDLELYGVLKQEWAGPENQAVKGSSPANEVENS